MTAQIIDESDFATNPLDIVEELVLANDWPFQRFEENELLSEIRGSWAEYRLFFVWHEDTSALHFCCRIDIAVLEANRPSIAELLAIVNERLWVGHFDLSTQDRSLTFRHTSLLRGISSISSEIIEDLVDLAIGECDRYYPAFEMVAQGTKPPLEAISASIVDHLGEA